MLEKKGGCVFRLSNIYGKGMKSNIFEDIREQLNINKNSLLIKNTNSQIDLVYIEDLIRCLKKSIEKGLTGLFNLSSKEETTPLAIINKIFRNLNITKKIIQTDPNSIGYLIADNRKIKSNLDWSPQSSLDQGIKDLIKIGYFYE